MGDTTTSSRAQTLPKAARVRKRTDYLSIQNGGKRLSTRHFLVVYRPGRNTDARLGITVTKKIGCAVIRNRVKRAVRETFRQARRDLPAVDLVVIVRKGAGALRMPEVAAELAPALNRLPGEATS
ncbi:MAG: ribonuclease P protein component [Candidatus Binatia bacterium]|nr:ribonuclease P protein component [Candidatus Binatia bacterium]